MPQEKNQRLSLCVALALIVMGGSYLTSRASYRGVSPTMQSPRPAKAGTRIILEHADLLAYDAALQPGVQRLKGGVVLRHGNATMTCDSAYLNEDDQIFEAFGEVHMVQGDTVHMYSRYLYYDGVSKLARLRHNVHLANKTTDLYTDSLDYDRIADIAYYFEGGTITDAQNTLTSDYGQFIPATNDAEFRYNVKLINDKTTMTTEHLFYNTHTRISSYEGQTLIQSDSGQIVSQRGIYDVGRDVGILLDRSEVTSGAKTLIGDSIYYDGMSKFGEAFGRMELSDTVQKAILYGDYGYFDDKRNYAFATSRAHAEEYSQKDTLYVSADTLELISLPTPDRLRLDSLRAAATQEGKAKPDTMQRYLRGYRNVRVFRRDAQAVADSLSYISMDSTLSLYGKPILWSEERQLSGDTTHFYFRSKKLDYVDVLGKALVVEHIDSVDYYNQMSGDSLRAYVQDSTVREILVRGKVESIYYMKEDGTNDYNGLNRMTSSTMHVLLDSGKVKKSIWRGPVEGKAYPLEMASGPEVNRLPLFQWAADRRPMRKEDIPTGGDSLPPSQQRSRPLSDLKRFSGAKAALAAYEPFERTAREEALRTDSLLTQYRALRPEEYRQVYQCVLRPTSDSGATSTPQSYLDYSWVYRPFSSKEDLDNSSTSSSTGIPERKN
ncbi:OstA-like protein [uncultured Porphyromonas sp.]|uniref:OstA-like protein n=1 Tax=uncultured Porphyromonas sp. TaxID=159274 RepID=UPI0025943999|nr:OstA-like protein [uncultured Porphyromonas sp.]